MATIGPSTSPVAAPALATATDAAPVEDLTRTRTRPARWTAGRVLVTLLQVVSRS